MELKKGETIMIDAALHLPASFLHEAFSDRSGVPLDFFELYYRGKRLEREAALASWGVGKGSTIEVKMRGRGGTSNQKGKQPQEPEEGPSSSLVYAEKKKAAEPATIFTIKEEISSKDSNTGTILWASRVSVATTPYTHA